MVETAGAVETASWHASWVGEIAGLRLDSVSAVGFSPVKEVIRVDRIGLCLIIDDRADLRERSWYLLSLSRLR